MERCLAFYGQCDFPFTLYLVSPTGTDNHCLQVRRLKVYDLLGHL